MSRILIVVLLMLLVVGCTQSQSTATPTPTPTLAPTATAVPSSTPRPTETPVPTATAISAPTGASTPIVTATRFDESSHLLQPDQVVGAVADVYGHEVLERDLDHVVKCRDAISVAEAGPISRAIVEELAVLIDGYPPGYLLGVPADEQKMDFRSFDDSEVVIWCHGIIQNIEEHLAMRAWGLVLQRRGEEEATDVLAREWQNVATTLGDFAPMIAAMSQPETMNPGTAALYERVFADFRPPPDASANPWKFGDLEQDAETWARCVTYIDDRTQNNLDAATESIAAFFKRYSIADPAKVLQMRRSEKKFVTGPMCVSFKNWIEKRLVANLDGSFASQ